MPHRSKGVLFPLLLLHISVVISQRDSALKSPLYNPYSPVSEKATSIPADPNNFEDVFPEKTPGSSSHRAAFAEASNCFKTGGGKIPEYYVCASDGDLKGHYQQVFCQTDVALHCLDDLRWNRSRSVSRNCSYPAEKVLCTTSTDALTSSNRTGSGSCSVHRTTKSGMLLLGKTEHLDHWGGCCPILDGSVIS